MKLKGIAIIMIALIVAFAEAAYAADAVLYEYDGSFDDATFDTKDAIIGQGLNIDYVSHVGDMLARTKEDVGGEKDIFAHAEMYVFCSATVSRRVMEADPLNVAYCPYNVFVIQMAGEGGKVYVGHRRYPAGPMQDVQDLLETIAKEATGN